jgi:putative hydroxymethylpyrimidine transport system substrate-binding protein
VRVLSQQRRRLPLAALAATAAVALAALAGATATAASRGTGAASSVKIALDWFPNPDHVALYYAKEKGYFADHGVTVSLKTPSDPSAGLKLVATNKFDLAVYYEGDMFYAAQAGLPVIAVGALIPTPLNSMIAKAGSKVKTLKDVKGATIGSAGLPFDGAVLQTIAQRLHLAPNEIKGVNVGFNLVPALLTGKADAIVGGYWNIEAVQVKNKTGRQPVVFKMGQLGVPHYDELLIVANKNRLKSDTAYATAIRSFLAGLVQGITASRKDPAGSIAIMKKSSSYKADELNGMVPLTLKALATPTGLKPGCFSTPDWQSFGAWLLKNKLLKKPIAATAIETNAYMPDC